MSQDASGFRKWDPVISRFECEPELRALRVRTVEAVDNDELRPFKMIGSSVAATRTEMVLRVELLDQRFTVRGRPSLWRLYPSGERCTESLEARLDGLWERYKWDVEREVRKDLGAEAQAEAWEDGEPPRVDPRGVGGDRCEVGNNCGRLGCPECQQ